ncbi:hypothetical protein [Fimbriiglobus ruber]|uniref:Uncharacterized protein n=1 Tax=Fimbriiglobus ruber TaxID=1908690 RepID=A0A225DZP5_9BACT|nr:hypothetical protein [Fimbriiglobus ruber]OWK46443.1 hypothetical protein FRUB_00142 [Fimbriiglobus ruber]
MMLQHVSAQPDLTPLPAPDRPAVARALAKNPAERFRTCVEFLHALIIAESAPVPTSPSSVLPSAGASRFPNLTQPAPNTYTPLNNPPPQHHSGQTHFGGADKTMPRPQSGSGAFPYPSAPPGSNHGQYTGDRTARVGVTPSLTIPALITPRKPPGLVTPGGPSAPASGTSGAPTPPMTTTPGPRARPQLIEPDPEILDLIALTPGAPKAGGSRWPLQLPRIWPVMPVAWLNGIGGHPFDHPPTGDLAQAITRAACPDGSIPPGSGEPVRFADGTWASLFPSRQISGVARVKLDVARERWGFEVTQPDPSTFLLRRAAQSGSGILSRWSGKKPAGLEIVIQLPTTGSLMGGVELTGRLYGTPSPEFAKEADLALPQMLSDIRKLLQNVEDRRRDIRLPASFPISLYPVHGDGTVLAPLPGKCRNVSFSGVCCVVSGPVDAAHVFVAFEGVPVAAGWAILTRLSRANPDSEGHLIAGRFRVDL